MDFPPIKHRENSSCGYVLRKFQVYSTETSEISFYRHQGKAEKYPCLNIPMKPSFRIY